ncbi:MAG: hypothetical protein GY786_09155 [Proteobacteria bacterium]|nr:hypothetical protein [Pseudomonadota bacterium]
MKKSNGICLDENLLSFRVDGNVDNFWRYLALVFFGIFFFCPGLLDSENEWRGVLKCMGIARICGCLGWRQARVTAGVGLYMFVGLY